jgi:PAS domain S-box-containing protein
VNQADTLALQEIVTRVSEKWLELSGVGFYAVDCNLRYVFWSEGMFKITGITEDEVIGKEALEVFPFLREIGQEKVFSAVLRGETVIARARPFKIPESGRSGYLDASYFPHFSTDGQVAGVLGIVTDVTEQKKASDLQVESESRFRNMADSSPVMLWMAGTDALCNFFNQSWLQFSGKSMAKELGVGWAEGIHPLDFQNCMDTYLSCFSERRAFEMEYRLLRHDGQYRWILDRGTPRFSTDNRFEGYIGSCIDITERKMIEDELRKSIRLREDFLSIASHELKTPLTSLSLQIQMFQVLFQNTQDLNHIADKVPPMMAVAERQLRQMAEMIEKMLDISRIEHGNFKLEPEATDLAKVARDTVTRLEVMAKQFGCRLVVSAESVVGLWDPSRLAQVISNLVMNSIRYAGGTEIDVRVEKDGNRAVIEVEDQGPGIPKDILHTIFDKFYRGTTTQNPGGLGLGLFIVKQIVNSHGGKVEAHNKIGQGVIFRVELPLKPAEPQN